MTFPSCWGAIVSWQHAILIVQLGHCTLKRNTLIAIAAVGGIVGAVTWFSMPEDHDHGEHGAITSGVKHAKLSETAEQGRSLFNANCAVCHGKNASGSQSGPPLVHKIYEPNHHSDLSFRRAAKFGVRAHHWSFGNMPPVPAVTESDVTRIVAYVRELQRVNGIR